MEAVRIWQENFKIRSYEVYSDGYATMPTICNYLQESAGNHAKTLGLAIDQMEENNWTWFLSRLKVVMKRYPKWSETIAIRTWPSVFDRAYTFRDFEICDENGEVIGAAISTWVVIDLNTRRPIRVPEKIRSLKLPERKRALQTDMRKKLSPPKELELKQIFKAGYKDLDVNQHVNNVHYLEWALEVLPENLLNTKTLKQADILFRSECLYGDSIISSSGRLKSESEIIYNHHLQKESDGTDLAIVETSWS